MTKNKVIDDYFEWIFNLVCGKRYSEKVSFRRLLRYLHDTEFTWLIPNDQNRAEDGINLRYRFAYNYRSPAAAETYLDGPCSVLEMIAALAIRCEENIMDDASYGDRTGQWFWGMIVSLGLGSMTDEHFNEQFVEKKIERFLRREYESNGKGGLFTIRHYDRDLRDVEIWYQLCWYLDSIT